MWKKLLLLGVLVSTAVACASANSTDPGLIVEQYMQAKVESDGEAIRSLLCADMEANLEREAMTFSGVQGATIEEMACQRVGETDTVACTGQIVALYGTEENVFPLTTYRVVQEDGEWKWCGESY